MWNKARKDEREMSSGEIAINDVWERDRVLENLETDIILALNLRYICNKENSYSTGYY